MSELFKGWKLTRHTRRVFEHGASGRRAARESAGLRVDPWDGYLWSLAEVRLVDAHGRVRDTFSTTKTYPTLRAANGASLGLMAKARRLYPGTEVSYSVRDWGKE